jgi:amino acid transporter
VGRHTALFVALSLLVFILLTRKYAEVSVRYPRRGGVVTVSADALHPYAGLLGGLFILVDYFLTMVPILHYVSSAA